MLSGHALTRALTCAAVLATVARPACAAESWIVATTPHFELYTTASRSEALATIAHFEQVRNFFEQTSPFARAFAGAVRIVAFSSAAEFDPYRLNDASDSFFVMDQTRDYIVLRSLDPDHYREAVHEYTHLTLAHSGLNIPLWFNEGWADLNSTFKPKGSKVIIGDMITGRRDTLLRGGLIPLAELEKVNRSSPFYNERDKASVFYAESWAFVHMLFLAPEYGKQFDAFVHALLAGASLAAACNQAFHKPLDAVQKDLEEYMHRDRLYGAAFSIKAPPPSAEPTVTAVSPLDSGLMLAHLLVLAHRTEPARAAYEALAKSNPNRPEIDAGLGELALGMGQNGVALRDFSKALNEGSRDADMCFRLAMLAREESPDRVETIKALRRVLELEPDNAKARIHLGVALLESQDYAGSLKELQTMRKITEENAAWYFSVTAFDYARLGKLDEARKSALTAKKWAKTPSEIAEADKILHFLDAHAAQQKPAGP